MAIVQVRDLAAARRRVAGLGVRVVWAADLPDIAATGCPNMPRAA